MIYFSFFNVFDSRIGDNSINNDELLMVGVSQLGSESVWRTANTDSVQQTLSTENGYFLLFNNARQIQENQIKDIRGYISQKVDYIVFSPVTETGWDTVLNEARSAGIPVILMDRAVDVKDSSLYVTRVGSDMNEEGIYKILLNIINNRVILDNMKRIAQSKGIEYFSYNNI